jgi:RNA polymerase sigma-70 factor (ECF subfamily)
MTGDRDTAFDLAQETFVSAWEHLGGFRFEARFENWLYRIASNKALNHLSRGSVSQTVSLEDGEAGVEAIDEGVSPDRLLERGQLREDVLGFMASLPPQQRLVFELRFYKQMDFGEIAEATGRALGTVKTNYREAVAKLRVFAQEKGWHA